MRAPANGCPDITRTLSFKYNRKTEKNKGTVRPAGGCAGGEKVKIFRVKPGPDRKVFAARTKAGGTYAKRKHLGPGRYYAKIATRTVASGGNCLAKKSKTVRVR